MSKAWAYAALAALAAVALGGAGVAVVKTREAARLRADKAGLEQMVGVLRGQVEAFESRLGRETGERLSREEARRAEELARAAAPAGPAPAAPDPAAMMSNAAAVALAGSGPDPRPAGGPGSEGRTSFRDRMRQGLERLRAEQPEEYARIQTERQERRQVAATTTREQTEFLKSIPVDGLSDDYLGNHRLVVEKMEAIALAMEQMADDPESEASGELRHQVFEGYRELGGLLAKEKDLLLTDLASSVGYSGQEASDFIEYVKYIEGVTSPGPRMFGRGGPRGEPPPPVAPPP